MDVQADNFLTSPAWLRLRNRALVRDRERCTVAQLLGGACSDTLHVHHIRSRKERPDLALDIDNLGTACDRHHPTWEAVRRFIVRQRDKAIDKKLSQDARRALALAEARQVAGTWEGDSVGLHDELDAVERRHRVMLRWVERDEIVSEWQNTLFAAA